MNLFFIILFFSFVSHAKVSDYKGTNFLNENIKIGIGMAYSKLENGSELGNYFLLSQANPRLEITYNTGVQESFKQSFSAYAKDELFRTENTALIVKTKTDLVSYGFFYEPMWLTENQSFAYGLKFGAKSGSVISEIPDPFNVRGDVATRYSAEGGLSFSWYGQTVAKFPLSLNLELMYSQQLWSQTILTYSNGLVYRFSLEFDFKRKTLFSGWNVRAFYEYEDVQNSYKNFVDKDIGMMINKVFLF